MIGYIGLTMLIGGYIILLTKKEKWFAPINCLASIILTIHAISIHDVPFIFVNGLVSIALGVKTYQQYKDKIWHK